MKNLKKVLAFVVVFAIMFTFAVSASPFPDVADSESYAEAATILNGIGIMIGDEQGNFNPDKSITRAEAATIIVRAKALGDAAAGAVGATAFTDVPASHWASGFINIAAQSGIVAGYGDGTFGPEDPVTYEQMVKLIVAALGYTPKANVNGGYPTGYLVIASQEGITKGAAGNAGDPAPRKTVARLVANALDVPMMIQTVYSVGNEEYAPSESWSDTFLGLLNIDKYEGAVVKSYITDNNSTSKTDKDVTIRYTLKNNNEYTSTREENLPKETALVGDTNAADFFGYTVVAYVGENEDGDDEIVAVAPKSGKNSTITLDYSQIQGVNPANAADAAAIAKVGYRLNPSDSTEWIEIDDAAVYYYNGRVGATPAYKFITQGTATVKPGKVVFLDNNADDDYDFVFVTEYTNDYVVDAVNASKQTITTKEGDDIRFDNENAIYTYYDVNGNIASFDDIEVDDVITLAKSADRNGVIAVYISKTIVEGTVTEITSDDDPYYRIDGSLYRASAGEALDVGDEGVFYLNVDNRVVYDEAVSNKAAGNYAFLYAAQASTEFGKNKTEVQFLTGEGEWITTFLADKVTVYKGNGHTSYDTTVNTADTDAVASLYKVNYGAKTVELAQNLKDRVFKFSLNSSGNINKLYISTTNSDKFEIESKAAGTYKSGANKIGALYLQDDIVVFNAPKTLAELKDEDDVTVSTVKATFKDGTDYDDIYPFDAGNDGYPSLVLALGASADIDPTTRVFVLTSIASVNNSNGTSVKRLYGYQEGEKVSAEITDGTVTFYDEKGVKTTAFDEDDLKAGDAIIFSLDTAGNIDKIQRLMTADAAKQVKATGITVEDSILPNAYIANDKLDNDGYTVNYFAYATKKNTNNRLVLTFADGSTEELSFRGSSYNVYEVNMNTSKNTAIVDVSTYSDIDATALRDKTGAVAIQDGDAIDMVYVRMYDGAPVDVVVYTYDFDANFAD